MSTIDCEGVSGGVEGGESLLPTPWFATYNGYCTPSVSVFPLNPFPAHAFCGNSPWEEHVVIAHQGVEPYARRAGKSVDEYLLTLIRQAPKRGSFCARCPNQSCANGNG